MVSRHTGETALLVAIGIIGFVAAQSLETPEVFAGLFLVAFAVVAPTIRGEQRRRRDA
ncbi:hypothetical protein ACFQMA_19850 [Halosimplex aquaticum]|uniref:Uncharacterized protein n=1 Tax=Halosimplex aquaticum TaxID=3026162 RepID=A0ABD5Y8Q7_9EURY|nr:hypothetical protein [Halosimplex aquaticum]